MNAIKFLEMYAAVAEKANILGSLAEACNAIGIMYSNMVLCRCGCGTRKLIMSHMDI